MFFAAWIDRFSCSYRKFDANSNNEDVNKFNEKLEKLISYTKNMCGFNPFPTLSFLTLLVIPELKLSDKGLFDVNKFAFINLEN